MMSPSTHPDPNPNPNSNPDPNPNPNPNLNSNPNPNPNQVDYDVTFAVVATTALSFAWQAAAPLVERIELPATLSPTCHYGAAALGGAGHFRADCVGTSQAAAGDH
eukprot:scaffold56380_cov48-Phaeocystis_antarctica.AAC.2